MIIQKSIQLNVDTFQTHQSDSFFCKLPLDIIVEIFRIGSFQDSQKLSATCKFLRSLFLKRIYQVINIKKLISNSSDAEKNLAANLFEKIENLGIREKSAKNLENPKICTFLTEKILGKVQKYFPDIRNLSSFVSKMTELKEIKLKYIDYKQLDRLPFTLVKIELIGDQPATLSSLASMTRLKSLNIRFEKGLPDSHLSNLPTTITNLHIQNLQLSSNSNPFSQLTKLERLELPYCEMTSSLQSLTLPTSLTELDLRASNFSNYEGLKGLTSLKFLNLSMVYFARSKDLLKRLPDLSLQLQKILLEDRKIEDISSLSQLTHLTCLSLKGCKEIKKEQLKHLPPSLKELDLNNTTLVF